MARDPIRLYVIISSMHAQSNSSTILLVILALYHYYLVSCSLVSGTGSKWKKDQSKCCFLSAPHPRSMG